MKLILGSASKWRRKILEKAGYVFSVMAADIDEKRIRHEDPKKLALLIAQAKAEALLPKITESSILITTDQVVFCNERIFEKPSSEVEARHFLETYQKYSAATITAIVITNTSTKNKVYGIDIVNVDFNPIPKKVIEHLISEGEIFHCAGGFQIEDEHGELNPYIKKIDGAIDSVKGLPMLLLKQLLQEIKTDDTK